MYKHSKHSKNIKKKHSFCRKFVSISIENMYISLSSQFALHDSKNSFQFAVIDSKNSFQFDFMGKISCSQF